MTIDAGYFLDHLTMCLHCDRPGSEHEAGGWTFREGKPVHTTCVAAFDRDYDALSGIEYCACCHEDFSGLVRRAPEDRTLCIECDQYFGKGPPLSTVVIDVGALAREANASLTQKQTPTI
jgi:hypothetical protein